MRNVGVLFVFMLMTFSVLRAQTKGDVYFESNYYNEAIHYLEIDLNQKNKDEKEVLFKLAESHYQLRNLSASLDYYVKLYELGVPDSLTIHRLFDLHRSLCNYDEAEVLTSNHPTLIRSLDRQNKIDFPKENATRSNFDVLLMESFNSEKGMGYDFINDTTVIFSNTLSKDLDRMKGNNFSTLNLDGEFVSQITFERLKALGVSYPSYNPREGKLYFSASNFEQKRSFKKKDNVLQVYEADFDGTTVKNIQRLPFISENYNYTHPSISLDGKKLFFISDLPGGFGGSDIYWSKKGEDNKWSDPINCGSNINTIYDELTPNISGDTLFFSSYGHQNYGGSDVFSSIYENGVFSKAQNMGIPINSCQDDFAFVLSPKGEFALFTSNRSENESNKDLVYSVYFPLSKFFVSDSLTNDFLAEVKVQLKSDKKNRFTNNDGAWEWRVDSGDEITFDHPYYWRRTVSSPLINNEYLENIKLVPVILSGKTVDDITGNPISDVNVTLYEQDGDSWNVIEMKQTTSDGNWSFRIRKDKEYKVEFEKDKYLTGNELVGRFDDRKELHNEAMERVNPFEMSYKPEKNLVMQIDNIYFDYNKASLRSDSHKVLDKLTEYLQKNPTIKIELSAHTDCMGKDSYNLKLSQRRANSCKEYLLNKGIEKSRIIPKGYGKRKMIITDCELQRKDDAAAQKNRRVEVKIL